MKYHFLNSFNLGAGYEDADYVEGRVVRPERKLPDELDLDYKNGGCLLSLRVCKDYAYLLVKKILYVNKQKTLVQQGRTVNINFSIEATLDELSQLCDICAGVLTEWGNFCRRLGDIVQIPSSDNNEYGYSIDKLQFDRLFFYIQNQGRNAVLPTRIGKALKSHSSQGILLVVPSEDVLYYIDNFKAIDPSGKKGHFLLKNWDCVLSASRDPKKPMEFEKLTSNSFTKDYDAFLNLVSVKNEQGDIKVIISNKEIDNIINPKDCINNEEESKGKEKGENNVLVIKEHTIISNQNTDSSDAKKVFNTKENSASFNKTLFLFVLIIGVIGFVLGYIVGSRQ